MKTITARLSVVLSFITILTLMLISRPFAFMVATFGIVFCIAVIILIIAKWVIKGDV